MTLAEAPGSPPPEGLLTVAEAARYLRTSVAGLHQLRYRRHGPPGVRIGRRLLFRASDLNAWLAGHVEAPRR